MANMTETQAVFTCPACENEVMGRFTLEATPTGPVIEGSVEFKVKVIGLYIKHDCTPKAKRSSGEPAI